MRSVLRIFLVLAMVLVSLSSCKTSYVPIEKVVYRETVTHDTLLRHDSVLVRDSIFCTQKGDTVYKNKWHTEIKYKYIYRDKGNSFVKSDSIPVPYPVERELSKWEKFQLKYAIWSFGALCMIVVYVCIKLYRRFKNVNRNNYNQ